MKIGNKNKDLDTSVLACIACGAEFDITLTAFRNRHDRITGWVASCKECQPDLQTYEIIFQEKKP